MPATSARGPKFDPQKPREKEKKRKEKEKKGKEKKKLVQWPIFVIPVLGRQRRQASQLASSKVSEPTERLYLKK